MDKDILIKLCLSLPETIAAIVGFVTAFIAYVKKNKNQKFSEKLQSFKDYADTAMAAAEKTALTGASKKSQVIAAVEAMALRNGVSEEVWDSKYEPLISLYIDASIQFVNSLKK